MAKKRKVFGKNVYLKLWQERLNSIWRIFLVLMILTPLLFAGYFLHKSIFRSDTFIVKEIKVKGHKRLTKEGIYKIIQLPRKQRIFDVNLQNLSDRILKHPFIKDVKVQRTLPYTLSIDLVERDPFVIMAYGKKYYELDQEGVVLQELDSKKINEDSLQQPLLIGLRFMKGVVSPGRQVESHKVLKAIELMKEFVRSKVSASVKLKTINIGNVKQLVLATDKNVKIQIGGHEFKEKLENLSLLIEEKGEKVLDARYVDLRFGGVIIRPRKS